MKCTRREFVTLCLLGGMLPNIAVGDQPVTVFAASSLKSVLDEIAKDYPGTVRLAYGGSGALARQIMLGAPADLFLSANAQWMDQVEQAGWLRDGTRRDVLGNALALIAPKGAAMVDLSMPPQGQIAMGFLDAVPAGQYGRAAFQTLGLWGEVQPSVIQTDNVRAALALVARGEVPFGVVYETDALADRAVDIVARFPDGSHPPIRYPLALTKGASAEAQAFYQHLQDSPARDIFARHGFGVL